VKKKYFLIILFLILAMFLSGCGGGIVTPVTDEAKGKERNSRLEFSNQRSELEQGFKLLHIWVR